MGFILKNKNNEDTIKLSSSIFNDIRKLFLCVLFEKEYQDISEKTFYYFNEIKKSNSDIKFFFLKKDTHGTFNRKQIDCIINFFYNNKVQIYKKLGIQEKNDILIRPFIDYIDRNKENAISYWSSFFITV